MKRSLFLASLACFLFAGIGPVCAQEGEIQQGTPQPGAEHEYLSKWAGCWDVEFNFRQGPGAEPQKSKGKAWNRSDLNGFWMIGDVEGEMLGQPYRGHNFQGYDPYRKQSVMLGFDNLGDYYVYFQGPLDMEAGKFVGKGKMNAQGQDIELEQIISMPDANTQEAKVVARAKLGEQNVEFTPMEMSLKRCEGPDRRPGEEKILKAAFQPPGKEHKRLEKYVGTWDAHMELTGMKTKGVMKYELGYGGYWLTMDFEANFGPMLFKGHGMLGYDRNKKKYVSAWVDSMTPTMTLTEGNIDGEVFIESSEGVDPRTGKTARGKNTTRFLDDDTIEWKMFEIGEDGKEAQLMKITYKRRKAGK